MDEKDIQKIIEEDEQKVQLRNFDEVWSEIKDVIEAEKPKKKKTNRWIYAVASVAACLVIMCSVGIPLLLNSPEPDIINPPDTTLENEQPSLEQEEEPEQPEEIIYYHNELSSSSVDKNTFFDKINSSNVNVVNLDNCVVSESIIYVAPNDVVKGGKILFTYSIEESVLSFDINMSFVSSDVKADNVIIEYDKNYSNNGLVAKYKTISSQQVTHELTFYTFAVSASFNSVDYTMEIMTNANADQLPEFFNDFFV